MTYPIQTGKIQAPALRDETLARTRLLDWLEAKIHSRVVFVIADAGYGKTTLLADFSRRTRLRTIWYRIDEDDRDWVGFLSHLVAAGREHDPDFASRTAGLLRSLEPGGATREDAIEAFLAELPSITTDGAALIFDDFHIADEVPDVRLIAREIVARAPERLTIVFASRRAPSIPVSKLRTLGELAELGLTDLRFSDAEVEQLFRETYGRPLEPDVLLDLAERTEGWAASLTLVRAALRERGPAEIREFVRGLSGARDELHDYLAEEVVGELPAMQQQFMMRTSILQRVTPELAQVASGLSATEVQSLITDAERLGMLGRRASRRSPEQRYHPLVREFLEERLRRAVGPDGVVELHLTVARWAEPADWQTAAHHYAAALHWDDLLRVLELHIETILGVGAFAAAAAFVGSFPRLPPSAAVEVLLSRAAALDGDVPRASDHARSAANLKPEADAVVQNLIAVSQLVGDFAKSRELAIGLIRTAISPIARDIAIATKLNLETSISGDIAKAVAFIAQLAVRNRQSGHTHYEGVSLLNLALLEKARGGGSEMLAASSRAVDVLSEGSSGFELVSARLARAWALAWQGQLGAAREELRMLGDEVRGRAREEFLVEFAELEATFGDHPTARHLLDQLPEVVVGSNLGESTRLTAGLIAIRSGDYSYAMTIAKARSGIPADPGTYSRALTIRAVAAFLGGDLNASDLAREAVRHADAQHADRFRQIASIALAASRDQLTAELVSVPAKMLPTISEAAEVVVSQLSVLRPEAASRVADEAAARPERWRPALRQALASGHTDNRLAAARLLDVVGEQADIPILRAVAREPRRTPGDRQLGRSLARRLAPQVQLFDLGRVRVQVGALELGAGQIRRKVLALLCYLVTRPRFTATREEAMDAMWPEMDPSAALNSLNQSVYFLRRVFEPEYDEDTTPGYLHQEGDVIYLDADLVHAESAACAELIARCTPEPLDRDVEELITRYGGRFAADFAYEEWASDFRESLHIGFLRVVEAAIRLDLAMGRYAHGAELARHALTLDPRHDALELLLLKLLKGSGAHSAAAEQYEHYAAVLRKDVGVDPPPFHAL